MARLSLPVAPLALALAACGGGDSRAQTAAPAPQARAPVRIDAPAAARRVPARGLAGGRLGAVVRVAGRAAPGQQLALRGACGGYSCDGITFAASDGRWRTRIELVTPRRARRVALLVAYADPAAGERPARVVVRLRRMRRSAPAPASSRPEPAKGGEAEGTATTGGQAAPPTSAPSDQALEPDTGPRTMIVIGDSLAVGMAGTLRTLLDDWTVPVDARTGRPLGEGMEVLAETRLPSGQEGERAILAFSLGTNDAPNPDALEAAVRESMGYLGRRGCAVWATIARPPLGGVSYRATNARLEALEADPALYGRLLVVPWAREYARRRSWRRSDGVHATAEGYAGRARLYAEAARACPA